MTESTRPAGKTTVSPDVLIMVARMAALSVPGVSRMAAVPGGVNRIFRRGASEGVRINISSDVVTADLYLVVKGDFNLREVGREVQQQVTRAIREMIGMDVGRIDIHVEDIEYEVSEA